MDNLILKNEEQYLLEADDSVKIPANSKHKWENF